MNPESLAAKTKHTAMCTSVCFVLVTLCLNSFIRKSFYIWLYSVFASAEILFKFFCIRGKTVIAKFKWKEHTTTANPIRQGQYGTTVT